MQEIIGNIRAARERQDVLRIVQNMAALPEDYREKYAHFAGISLEFAATLDEMQDFFSHFDEHGEVTDERAMMIEAAELINGSDHAHMICAIMRQVLGDELGWSLVTTSSQLTWCTGEVELDDTTPGGLVALVREDSSKVTWLEDVTDSEDFDPAVEYDPIQEACWDADQTGTMVFIQPTLHGDAWEVWVR